MQDRNEDLDVFKNVKELTIIDEIYKKDKYKLEWAFYWLEASIRSSKSFLPQNKLAEIFYKGLGGKNHLLFSIPSTFLVMDILFHQIPVNLINYAFSNDASLSVLLNLDMGALALWTATGMSLALYKQFRTIDRNKIKFDLGKEALISKKYFAEIQKEAESGNFDILNYTREILDKIKKEVNQEFESGTLQLATQNKQ